MFDSDELTVTQIQGPDDLFDVRGQLLRKTNPLRSKILIFSTIYHQFDFSDHDWMALRTQELDALLRNLFDACPTLDELDSRLHRTARDLEGTEENLQAADLLVRCFTRFYVQDLPSRPGQGFQDVSLTPEPTGDPVTLGSHITENPVQNVNSDSQEEEDSDSSLFFDLTFNRPPAIAPEPQSDADSPAPQSPVPSSSAAPRLSDRLLQHLATTDEVQDLIRRSSKDLTEAIAQSITDLEMNLEATCAHVSPEEQLRIKHEAVTSLLNDVRLNINRIGGVLDHAPSQDSLIDEVQQQASQGTPRAIARWLIQRHHPLGLNLLATQKGRCLHLVLDLASLHPSTNSDPQHLASQMYESILELRLSSADRLKVHGREPGQKRPSWTRSFLL